MRFPFPFLILSAVLSVQGAAAAKEIPVSFEESVAPVLKKYCAGCHNDSDKEGTFSLESYASIQQGIGDQPAILPGDAAGSKLWRVLLPGAETPMPPEGETAPTQEELNLIKAWIEQGAVGPANSMPDRMVLHVPRITPKTNISPITALAASPEKQAIAIGQFGRVEIRQAVLKDQPFSEWKTVHVFEGFPGKVESIHYCLEGKNLITASGVTGAGGIATLWDLATGEKIRDFRGHRDILFDAEVSPDGKVLATCSYDREIILWDLETGEMLRTLSGHNGAVYDIAFNPAGTVLASASADDTCKLWRVRDGERLDTLGQPIKEQYAIEFSRDGKFVIAAGADHQIRVWKFLTDKKPTISPLLISRFAHEAPIISLALTEDGSCLISTAEDRTIKFWETRNFTEISLVENQPEIVSQLAVLNGTGRVALGRMDGNLELIPIASAGPVVSEQVKTETVEGVVQRGNPFAEFQEKEPNGSPQQAQQITLPARIQGLVYQEGGASDVDQYRFNAKAGIEWVIDVNAARSGSKLDSIIEILSADGKPVQRTILQAVRESYFTFRGKDGRQTGDFRLFRWEDMSLNELLYCNGEVVKFWRAPRGPDSGFDVYPGEGGRWGYFDTTGLTHALNEPCYVVQAHPVGTELIPNGLPVFPIYFENDDAARRESGKDSKLFFTAPADGEYILRVRDVRDLQGTDFSYTVSIRPPARDFAVTFNKPKLKIAPGNRTELRFVAQRKDQFDGQIIVEVNGLPQGFSFTNPLVIDSEQIDATGVISVDENAPAPTAEQLKLVEISATSTVDGVEVTHPVKAFEEIIIEEKPTFTVGIGPIPGGAVPLNPAEGSPLEFEIEPGQTIQLKVTAQRNGFDKQIEFGNAECGRNLPHGVYVDNIGLNGLMMLADQSEQEFFITAAPGVEEQTRLFHLRTTAHGEIATPPIILHIRKHTERTAAAP